MKQDAAETIALDCLGWLVGQDELLPVFLGATGATEADVRQRASQPEFLTSVLEFLTMDDAWVIDCCKARDLPYEAPMTALAVLRGEAHRHWT